MTKKLVWFHDNLLLSYHNPLLVTSAANNQYLQRLVEPKYQQRPELLWHQTMQVVCQRNMTMIDQSGTSRDHGDGMDLVTTAHLSGLPSSFDHTRGTYIDQHFKDFAMQRVDQLYDQAERIGAQEIRISWSGGIDSNFVLASVMMHPRSASWIKENRVVVYTTPMAKREDIDIWNWLVNSGLPIRYLDYDTLMKDNDDWIFVTGDGEPYGSTFYKLHHEHVDDQHIRYGHWSQIEPYMMEKDPTGLAWDYFRALIAKSPVDIETSFHAWWWMEANLTEQNFFYRLSSYSSAGEIDAGRVYPGQQMFWFLGSQDFADHGIYSVINRLIPERDDQVKPRLRELVAEWQGWAEPKPKKKFFSQFLIPKRIRKTRIYEDLTWDSQLDFEDRFES